MYIEKITLNNFRVYKGETSLCFNVSKEQNVSIISGNNGFGKTSLLISLLWCLYGKLIIDVDEIYRKDVRDAGGYRNYCKKLMNVLAVEENRALIMELRQKVASAITQEGSHLQNQINDLNSFSVTIQFSKIFIPSLPCDTLQVKRSYNVEMEKEDVIIFIDGKENELTKQVGPEIFINDFILRKEIAKFFFFDAEKIMSLVEARSLESRRGLSQAYTEVLGIKKYLDLRDHLENLRLRLRKKTAGVDEDKLNSFFELKSSREKMLSHNDDMIREKEAELVVKQTASDKLQERLIREGSSITVEELKELKQLQSSLIQRGNELKSHFRFLMDLAPFAIAGNIVTKVKEQLEQEQEHSELRKENSFFKRKLAAIEKTITENQSTLKLDKSKKQLILQLIESKLFPKEVVPNKPLLSFSADQENEILAIYESLQGSYSKSVKFIFSELKMQLSSHATVNKRIRDAESKAQDPVVQAIRADKEKLDKEIETLRKEIIELKASNLNFQNELSKVNAQLSELRKQKDVLALDKEKDETAARLINELNAFIAKLRTRKKKSLEDNILKELRILMHKSNFISKVEVKIDGELIDIELYDDQYRPVEKDSLSKGEQQLYASALLKALVEESHIRFPVFIDSPLQKFDKAHAMNIIQDFYPNISAQVVLFPLLEKEFTEAEYKLLYARVGNTYLIEQKGQYYSSFKEVKSDDLFSTHKQQPAYV